MSAESIRAELWKRNPYDELRHVLQYRDVDRFLSGRIVHIDSRSARFFLEVSKTADSYSSIMLVFHDHPLIQTLVDSSYIVCVDPFSLDRILKLE